MKKIIGIFALSALVFAGCKDNGDENGDPPGSDYPTANLKFDNVTRMLVLQQTSLDCSDCPFASENIIVAKAKYGEQVFHLSMHLFDPLQTTNTLELIEAFDTTLIPNIFINNTSVNLDILNNFEAQLSNNPSGASVNHAVIETDSGYLVHPIVKFNKEYRDASIRVQSYIVIDEILAINHGSMNLNQKSNGLLFDGVGSQTPTRWGQDAAFLDNEPLVKQGDPFYHRNVIWNRASTPHPFGFDLDSVHPFGGGAFFEDDIFGTSNTPIKLLLTPPTIPIEVEYSVATIVWELNSEGKYDFVGGFKSKL